MPIRSFGWVRFMKDIAFKEWIAVVCSVSRADRFPLPSVSTTILGYHATHDFEGKIGVP